MISYKPLLKLLIDKNLKKSELIETGIISRGTMNKMNSNKYVSLEVLDKLCNYFNCQISELVEHIKDN